MKKIIIFLGIFFFSFGISYAIQVPISTNLGGIIPWCGSSSCSVWTGFSVVKDVMWGIIKYFTYLAGLAWVLYIVINGVMYSMAGINDGLKASAKERIQKMLYGLVLLMLSGVILNIIAPWIYK